MANWYGTSRSNYVKFIPEKLKILKELFSIEACEKQGKHAVISETYEGGTPSVWVDDDENIEELLTKLGADIEMDYFDLLDVIHLALAPEPDNVFVWMEVGAEKARYVTGIATAIDHTGRILKQINLNEIYKGTNWNHGTGSV